MTTTARVSAEKSTTVRFFSFSLPMRTAFSAVDRTAPALAARWAERIWFTLPQSPARPVPAPPGGHPFTVDVDGGRVVGQVWGEGPPVYLLHGWAGHSGQLAPFAAPLVGRGFRVVAFDAPSHGRSEPGRFGPRSSSVLEFAAALTAVVTVHGPAHALIAHSLGGTAAAVAVSEGLRAGRIALLAPMASPLTYARQLAEVLGFGEPTYRRLIARVERRVGAPMHQFDLPELGRAAAMPPTLIIHDRTDASTPLSDGAAIAAAWPSARLHVTSGLGHRRLLRDPDVIAEVVGFITEPG